MSKGGIEFGRTLTAETTAFSPPVGDGVNGSNAKHEGGKWGTFKANPIEEVLIDVGDRPILFLPRRGKEISLDCFIRYRKLKRKKGMCHCQFAVILKVFFHLLPLGCCYRRNPGRFVL